MNLGYDVDVIFIVVEIWEIWWVNCLVFILLFVSLVCEVGIDVYV